MTIVQLDPATDNRCAYRGGGVRFGNQIIHCYPAGTEPQFAIRETAISLSRNPPISITPPLCGGPDHGFVQSYDIPLPPLRSFGVVHNNEYSLMGPPSWTRRVRVCGIPGTPGGYPPKVTSAVIYR